MLVARAFQEFTGDILIPMAFRVLLTTLPYQNNQFALSCFMNSALTRDSGIDQLRWSQLVRAMGQPLIRVPLSTVATAGLPAGQAGSASGLFNMMRNLAGSFGIAAVATLLIQRQQFYSNRLGESVLQFNNDCFYFIGIALLIDQRNWNLVF